MLALGHARPPVVIAAAALLISTACGSSNPQVTQPTAGVKAVSSSPAAVQAAGPTPTAIISSPPPTAVAAPSPVAAAPSPVAAASPIAAAGSSEQAAPTDVIVLQFVADGTEARYRVKEQLASRTLPNDAVGVTNGVTGTIVLGPSGAVVADRSRISVDLTSLRSDDSRRDNYIQRNTLETSRFPAADFVATEARALPVPLPTSGEATFQLVGDLTVHGVTRPASWDVTARFADRDVSGSASTAIKMTDFDMTPPRVGPVLSIEDQMQLEIDFRAARG